MALMRGTNRGEKYNGGNELEEEGELNYHATFFRKYDAQIGRFTGIDIYAEQFAGINPYQFGANNPVMFNDPMGDKFFDNGRMKRDKDGNYHIGWVYDLRFGSGGEDGFDRDEEGSGGGGGGSRQGNSKFLDDFVESLFKSFDAAKDNEIVNFSHDVDGSWFIQTMTINGGKDADGSIVLVGGNDIFSENEPSALTKSMSASLSSFFKENKLNINIGSFSSNLGGSTIASIVTWVKDNHNAATPLFVYGYSLGGHTANQAIKALGAENIRVNVFFAVDAAIGFASAPMQISKNVDRVINAYQLSASNVGSHGYPAFRMSDNNHTRITNQDYTGFLLSRGVPLSRMHGEISTAAYSSVLLTFQVTMLSMILPK